MSVTADQLHMAFDIVSCALLAGTWAMLRRQHRQKEQAAQRHSKAHSDQLLRKDLLIHEVHHRVANQMGLTAALLHLQASRSADPVTKASLFESESRIRTLSKLHARLHHTKSHSQVALFPYLSELAGDMIISLHPNLTFCPVLTGSSPFTASTTAITCGLLMHELVTNCIKHAFRQQPKGVIRVSLSHLPGNRLFVSVHDNGVGLPAGFSIPAQSTSGMAIISALTKDLGGIFSAVHHNPGAEFIVEFPLPENRTSS